MAKFPQRKIGGDSVSAIGLGCMGMSFAYTSFGGQNDDEALKVLTRAADLGITFWDTADMYGPFTNERLIGRWFKETGRRDEIFLATKFANKFVDGKMVVDGRPEYVKECCKNSLERLGTDRIDLYYQHRVDSNTPIEKTVQVRYSLFSLPSARLLLSSCRPVPAEQANLTRHTPQAMAELKAEGKIRHLGLSECSSRTLERAHKVHPIAAVQVEYSPFALEIESPQIGLLAKARELGVKIVPYSPLGRGFLTGAIKSRDDLDASDGRRNFPRFSEENFAGNLKVVDTLAGIAREKGCTPGQLTLAWVLAQGDGE